MSGNEINGKLTLKFIKIISLERGPVKTGRLQWGLAEQKHHYHFTQMSIKSAQPDAQSRAAGFERLGVYLFY